MPPAPNIWSKFTSSAEYFVVMRTGLEASRFAVLSDVVLPPLSWYQTFPQHPIPEHSFLPLILYRQYIAIDYINGPTKCTLIVSFYSKIFLYNSTCFERLFRSSSGVHKLLYQQCLTARSDRAVRHVSMVCTKLQIQ